MHWKELNARKNLSAWTQEVDGVENQRKQWEHIGGCQEFCKDGACELCGEQHLHQRFEIRKIADPSVVKWVGSSCVVGFVHYIYDESGALLHGENRRKYLEQRKRMFSKAIREAKEIFALSKSKRQARYKEIYRDPWRGSLADRGKYVRLVISIVNEMYRLQCANVIPSNFNAHPK